MMMTRAMNKTDGTLCYTAERVRKLMISTMILHNICIKHGLQLKQEVSIEIEGNVEIEEDVEIDSHKVTTSR